MRTRLLAGVGVALLLVVGEAVSAETARPIALLDAATLRAEVGGQQRVVRLIGIVPPVDQACTSTALAALAKESAGEFALAPDPLAPDVEATLARYANVGERDFGAEAIRRGLALAAAGEYARAAAYRAAETEARKAQRGLWRMECGSALAGALAARNAPPPPPASKLPRGDAAAAQEAIAELQARNDRGENRVEVVDVTAPRPKPASTATAAAQGSAEERKEDAPEPGRARQLSGPRIRRLSGGQVRVEGKYWNTGETKITGRVRIELRDNGSLVDSGSVRLTLEPDGEAAYSIDLSPGAGTTSLAATATWEPGG